jgi:predicted metal-dependent enzyme (double-stranded beta helix superfamily)
MTLARLVRELGAITAAVSDFAAIAEAVTPLVVELALARSWLEPHHYRCDEVQGFGAHVLHEEPDHTLAVIAGSWLPGRGAPPHNHGTWAVVAGVDGLETNTLWTRLDDGSRPGHAVIRPAATRVLGPGEVITFSPDAIHSVVNETERVSVSLHVYGLHVNHAIRSQFDPLTNTEKAFKLTIA